MRLSVLIRIAGMLVLPSLAQQMPAQTAWTITGTTLPDVTEIQGIAYGNGVFLATLATRTFEPRGLGISTDGITWQASPFRPAMVGPIAFTRGVFYLGDGGRLLVSTNGISWTPVQEGTVQDRYFQFATDGRSLLSAVSANGPLSFVFSPDPLNWWSATALPERYAAASDFGLGYLNGRYYASYSDYQGIRRGASTVDALDWTSVPELAIARDLVSGNGRLVIRKSFPTSPAQLTITEDGRTFADVAIDAATARGRMAYAGGRYFFSNSLQASTDARNWAPLAAFTPEPNGNIVGIAYGNGRYVAVGNTGPPLTKEVVAVLVIDAPPVIIAEPAPVATTPAGSARFAVRVDNLNLPTTYQWARDGVAIPGATTDTLAIDSVQPVDFGNYTVTVRNRVGTVVSAPARLSPPIAPIIVAQPSSRRLSALEVMELKVGAYGSGSLTYQWFKDGTPIPRGSTSSLRIGPAVPTDAGSYHVVVTNAAGSVASATATLAVSSIPPVITASVPAITDVTLNTGENLDFKISASGSPPLSYQWMRGTGVISGATNAEFAVRDAAPADTDSYYAKVSNAGGTATSQSVHVTVRPLTRLANLSVLASVSGADDSLTLGYVVTGASLIARKPVLLRAVGPTLDRFDVAHIIPDPRLEAFAGVTKTNENAGWDDSPVLSNAFAALAAFPFFPGSRDAAMLLSTEVPDNSVRISSSSGDSGQILAELYDASPAARFSASTPRLVNASVLKPIGPGFTIGFTIAGANSAQILIRAVGPSLSRFGVADADPDPRLFFFDSDGRLRDANDNWTGFARETNAFSAVGAFPLAPSSKDAALLTTLPPGSYSVQIAGATSRGGRVLVEVYHVP